MAENNNIVERAGNALRNPNVNAGAVSIEMSRAMAEVQLAMDRAWRNPRNEADARTQIIGCCSRLSFAEDAIYTYPRGGETVTGLTIRAAEEFQRIWGNMQAGLKELAYYENETEIQAYCWDLQANNKQEITFRSEHKRVTKSNTKILTDPRDIYENNANLGARRKRAMILACLPEDLKREAEDECRKTIASGGAGSKPLSERIETLVRAFSKFGVQSAHIETKLGHEYKLMMSDQYVELAGIYNSLKDGMTKPSDWFNVPKTAIANEAAQNVNDLLSGNESKKPAKQDKPKATQESVRAALTEAFHDDDGAELEFIVDTLGMAYTVSAMSQEQLEAMAEALREKL